MLKHDKKFNSRNFTHAVTLYFYIIFPSYSYLIKHDDSNKCYKIISTTDNSIIIFFCCLKYTEN